mmetsp:Transcript_9342/g.15503  ORF Transcript_9342/g.15503 Transcript_9342/m.15503 type:complete len:196 (-) Transcript_9342:477-1064(-)
MMLSPLAAPFHPRGRGEEEFGFVYNNGMPCASFVSGEHEVLQNIEEDSLDDAFPPDASEAAELDAVQDFVGVMSYLGLCEEQEERSRQDYSFARGKRWAARREGGLQGRPHPARNATKFSRDRSTSSEPETSIVVYDSVAHSFPANYDSVMQSRAARSNRHLGKGGNNRTLHHGQASRSIQQPRKSTIKNSPRLW